MLRNLTALAALLVFGAAAPAGAKGVVRVQQSDGSVQRYENATIKVAAGEKALAITTADGKGTLTIDRAACSFVEQIERCLLYSIILTQGGATKPLDFQQGTLYANRTGGKLTMPHSSQQLAPNGILIALRTTIGTYITVTGTIDSVAK